MRGERVATCDVASRGLSGDRAFAVCDGQGYIGSGKITRRFRPVSGLREHTARMAGEGLEITSPSGKLVACDGAALSASLGQPVSLAREGAIPHHDAGAMHLLSTASLAWISARAQQTLNAFAFRPNILFDTDVAWPAEHGWCGTVLAIGPEVRLRITEPTERCVMVNARDDGTTDETVLPTIARDNDRCLGVYARVTATGIIREGDVLELAT